MTRILRTLPILVLLAILGEAIYGFNLLSKARSTPRASITIGPEIDKTLNQPGRLTALVDGLLKTPIETPTPSDRRPPPLPPTPKNAPRPATTSVVPPVPKPEPGSLKAITKSNLPEPGPAESKPGQPVLEKLPPEQSTELSKTAAPPTSPVLIPPPPSLSKPENKPQPTSVAVVMPKSETVSPFAFTKPDKIETPPPPIKPPALGPVLAPSGQVQMACKALVELGATVQPATDPTGKPLADRFEITLDPAPKGGGISRLNPRLQNTLANALGNMGDALHTLSLRNLGLGNLAKIGTLDGLVKLDLSGSDFLNINPLTRLKRLEELNVSKTHVDNMGLMSQVENLRVLILSQAQVTDISPLSALKALEELNLSDTRVESIDVVARLPRLKVLDLTRSSVVNLGGLEKAASLERLGLMQTNISDLTPITGCKNLVGLDLSRCMNLVSLEPLAKLKNLETLSLYGSPVSDVGPLASCDRLKTLELSRTKLNRVEALSALGSLQSLYIRGLKLESLAPLARFPSLKLVDISETTSAAGPLASDLLTTLKARGLVIRP